MNRRAAKRLACAEGATLIRGHLEGSWEYDHGLSENDAVRYFEAIMELVKELERRGENPPERAGNGWGEAPS